MPQIILDKQQSDSIYLAYLNDLSADLHIASIEGWFYGRFKCLLSKPGAGNYAISFDSDEEMVEFKLRYMTA